MKTKTQKTVAKAADSKKPAAKQAKAKEPKAPRKSIARLVMGLIAKGGLHEKPAKEHLVAVCDAVRAEFPKSAFKDTHYYWYLTRFRKQLANNLPTDGLHSIPGEREPKAEKAEPKQDPKQGKPAKAEKRPAKKSKAAKPAEQPEVNEEAVA